MIRGIWASRLGMAFEQARSEVVADNVANLNTDGFKRSMAVGAEFAAILLNRLGDPNQVDGSSPGVGLLGNGAALAAVVGDGSLGGLQVTGQPLDVALLGPGEFVFEGPAGLGYTRNGSFHRDAQGRLVTHEGHPVLVGGGPIGVPGQELSIQADGTVLVDGLPAGRLDIRGTGSPALATGSVESSNVDLAQEMTEMITALRSFQVNQRALQMQDQTLAKAVSEIGRI